MKLRSKTKLSEKYKSIQEFNDKHNVEFNPDQHGLNKSIVLDILNGHISLCSNPKYYFYIANYYELVEKNYSETKIWFKKGIAYDHSGCINGLAVYYDTIEQNIPKAIKYYKMAIEQKNSVGAMYNLAVHYEEHNNIENAIYYYKMAIDHDDTTSIIYLAKIFQKKGYYKEAIQYYKMALDKNAVDTITFPKMNLVNWYIHQSIGEKCEFTDKTQPKEVLIFKQKMKILSKTQDCPVCCQEKPCLPFECCHYLCYSCYVTIMSEIHGEKICPLCRIKL